MHKCRSRAFYLVPIFCILAKFLTVRNYDLVKPGRGIVVFLITICVALVSYAIHSGLAAFVDLVDTLPGGLILRCLISRSPDAEYIKESHGADGRSVR